MSLSAEQIVEYRAFAEQLADAAAAAIAPYFRASLDVEDKGGRLYDPVTVADKAAEDAMRELIQARYPEHGILGEEAGVAVGSSPLTWVLDPIDGTRAFITGLPLWGTLIALNDGTRPVLGVMNQPFTGERFVGTPAGAWRSGTPLKTRACVDLSAATLMCTTPDMFDTAERKAAFEAVAATVPPESASTSAFTIRPLGPVPATAVRSRPLLLAIRLASGLAITRSLFCDGAGDAAATRGRGAAAVGSTA